MVPKLPLMILEKIFEYIPNNADRKNCRLVCNNWLYVIDILGLPLKLNTRNKGKLFASGLLHSCTSLTIYKNAGLRLWKKCHLSSWNLKSVEIRHNILSDNWKLLLEECKSMEELTMTTRIIPQNKDIDYLLGILKKPFHFPGQVLEKKINHKNLRRLRFKDVSTFNSVFNLVGDLCSIANMINTIGVAPRLQQFIITFIPELGIEIMQSKLSLKTALLSLMGRNIGLSSVGLLWDNTSFENMSVWDGFFQENRNVIVQSGGFYLDWRQIFDRLVMVDTVYFNIRNPTEYQAFLANFLRVAQRLKKLLLVWDPFGFPQQSFDCSLYLQGLEQLLELSIYSSYNDHSDLPRMNILNLNILTRPNVRLEYFYVSFPLSEINLNDIFAIPQLKELHIKLQDSEDEFKRQHFEMAVAHPHLKLIFLDSFLSKWNEFSTNEETRNWKFIQLKKQKAKHWYWSKQYVKIPDHGYMLKTKWKTKFADEFVVFNADRLNTLDRNRILAIAK